MERIATVPLDVSYQLSACGQRLELRLRNAYTQRDHSLEIPLEAVRSIRWLLEALIVARPELFPDTRITQEGHGARR